MSMDRPLRSACVAVWLLLSAPPTFGFNHGFDYNDPKVKWFDSKLVPNSKEGLSCCGKGDAYAVDRYEKQPNGDYKIWIENGNGDPITFPDGSRRPKIDEGEYIVPASAINPEDDDLDNPQGHSVLWATAYEGKITKAWCFVRHPNGF